MPTTRSSTWSADNAAAPGSAHACPQRRAPAACQAARAGGPRPEGGVLAREAVERLGEIGGALARARRDRQAHHRLRHVHGRHRVPAPRRRAQRRPRRTAAAAHGARARRAAGVLHGLAPARARAHRTEPSVKVSPVAQSMPNMATMSPAEASWMSSMSLACMRTSRGTCGRARLVQEKRRRGGAHSRERPTPTTCGYALVKRAVGSLKRCGLHANSLESAVCTACRHGDVRRTGALRCAQAAQSTLSARSQLGAASRQARLRPDRAGRGARRPRGAP